MIRITGLKIHNICQHRNLDIQIEPGLTAIVAPNGYGKTNLCRALMYGLTGMVDGLWGNQQTLQTDGTSTPGYVAVSFTDGKQHMVVKRYSTSSIKFPDTVTIDGEVVYQKRKTVDKFMEHVLGIPCSIMFQLGWARQGELAQLLTSTRANIASFLSQVFDMTALERLRDQLKLAADDVLDLSPGVVDALEQHKKELEELPNEKDLEVLISAETDKLKAVTAENAEIEVRVSKGYPRGYVRDSLLGYRKARHHAFEHLAKVKDVALPEGVSKEDLDAEYDRFSKEVSALTQEHNKLQPVVNYITGNTSKEEQKLEKILTGDKCVLCGQTVDADKLIEYQEKLRNLLGMSSKVDSEKTLEAAKARMAEIAELINKKMAQWDVNQEQRKKLDALETIAIYDKDIREALSLDVVSDSDIERQKELKKQIAELQSKIQSLHVNLSVIKTKREMLESNIKQDEKMVEQYTINKEVKSVLASLRDVFSRDRVQATFVKARIKVLNRELAKYMRMTNMPYVLKLDPQTRVFVFETVDGYTHPAIHLSGAQKSMSALALQMALYSVVEPGVNLYVIDEPTEALDEGNKTLMANMFSRMNQMLPTVGGTMLIVTRDQQTIENCANIINLEDLADGRDDSDVGGLSSDSDGVEA